MHPLVVRRARARSRRASSSRVRALLTPTDEPMLDGFTKHGQPSSASARSRRTRRRRARRAAPTPRAVQPRGREHLLHRDLVHPDRGAEHPRAHVRQAGELEQPLHGAVLAVRTVEQRDHHVDVERRRLGCTARHRTTRSPSTSNAAGSASRPDSSIRCASPASSQRPSVVIPTGTTSYLAGSSACGDRDRGDPGDVVLGRLGRRTAAAPAARRHADIVAHTTWSTARIPRPMMNRPPSP